MPEVNAQTFHPRPKLVDVVPDGEGGYKITITTSKGECEQLPLDLQTAARLSRNFSAAVHHLVNFQPHGEGPQI